MTLGGEGKINFDGAIGYVMYKPYNWLGVHRCPRWVLDLFLPFLCIDTTYPDVVMECWRHPRGFIVRPEFESPSTWMGVHRVMPDHKIKPKFPFHTCIENGYCARVDINIENDVIITVGFGVREAAERFCNKLRGRHKYE